MTATPVVSHTLEQHWGSGLFDCLTLADHVRLRPGGHFVSDMSLIRGGSMTQAIADAADKDRA